MNSPQFLELLFLNDWTHGDEANEILLVTPGPKPVDRKIEEQQTTMGYNSHQSIPRVRQVKTASVRAHSLIESWIEQWNYDPEWQESAYTNNCHSSHFKLFIQQHGVIVVSPSTVAAKLTKTKKTWMALSRASAQFSDLDWQKHASSTWRTHSICRYCYLQVIIHKWKDSYEYYIQFLLKGNLI